MYRIGELAKLANVTPDTIRYYEKQQMIDHEVRTEGGFRNAFVLSAMHGNSASRWSRSVNCCRSVSILNIIRVRNLKASCRPGWMKLKDAFRNCKPCSDLCKG